MIGQHFRSPVSIGRHFKGVRRLVVYRAVGGWLNDNTPPPPSPRPLRVYGHATTVIHKLSNPPAPDIFLSSSKRKLSPRQRRPQKYLSFWPKSGSVLSTTDKNNNEITQKFAQNQQNKQIKKHTKHTPRGNYLPVLHKHGSEVSVRVFGGGLSSLLSPPLPSPPSPPNPPLQNTTRDLFLIFGKACF